MDDSELQESGVDSRVLSPATRAGVEGTVDGVMTVAVARLP